MSGAAEHLQSWLNDIQLSAQIHRPQYANPGELKADLRALLLERQALRDDLQAEIGRRERAEQGRWKAGRDLAALQEQVDAAEKRLSAALAKRDADLDGLNTQAELAVIARAERDAAEARAVRAEEALRRIAELETPGTRMVDATDHTVVTELEWVQRVARVALRDVEQPLEPE